jgi:hypothetical protein
MQNESKKLLKLQHAAISWRRRYDFKQNACSGCVINIYGHSIVSRAVKIVGFDN